MYFAIETSLGPLFCMPTLEIVELLNYFMLEKYISNTYRLRANYEKITTRKIKQI